MPIRHVIAQADLDPITGDIVAPERARHAVITASRLYDVSGPIDVATHLNLDEPAHLMLYCVVVEVMARGAFVLRDGDGLLLAPVARTSFRRLGPVDHGARRSSWLTALAASRVARAAASG